MKIFTEFKTLPDIYRQTAVALGTFDGLHLGHQKIITQALKLAEHRGCTSAVFTFSNHPREIIRPGYGPKQLMSQEQKIETLDKMGLDVLVTVPFTENFLHITPHDFLNNLTKVLRPAYLVVGPNYTYGYKGLGTADSLKQAEKDYNFEVEIVDAVMVNDQIVSSTRIRNLLQNGHVAEAASLLGNPFSLQGKVVPGDQRGRTLGFPTANLAIPHDRMMPLDGVYAVRVDYGSEYYSGVANIGTNPTFQGNERRLEVFLLDFTGNLYEQNLTIHFHSRIRGEKKFHNAQELISQIKADIAFAKQEAFSNLYNY